jgi:hypothetical protein
MFRNADGLPEGIVFKSDVWHDSVKVATANSRL